VLLEKKCVTYFVCVFVELFIQYAIHMLHMDKSVLK